jgi:hypothetical protein
MSGSGAAESRTAVSSCRVSRAEVSVVGVTIFYCRYSIPRLARLWHSQEAACRGSSGMESERENEMCSIECAVLNVQY